jgi:MFS transporter, DHA3 family, macrolide efflux protein
VMAVVVLMSLTTLFLGVLQTLFAPMMLAMTDARTLGFVQSISASGMLVSSLVLGAVGISQRHEAFLILSLISAGVFLSVIGMTTRIGVITASFFLFFCTLPVINACADVLIRTRISNEVQGRAWGIIGLLTQLGFVAAYALSGLLADRVFTPLTADGTRLAALVGWMTGTGEGRGMALMLVISGIGLVVAAWLSAGALISGGQVPHTQEAVQQ